MNEEEDYKIFVNKSTEKIYVSKTFYATEFSAGAMDELKRPMRNISLVIDGAETKHFVKDGDEIVIRVTPMGRQEIKAKFYEDTRGIQTLHFQKWNTVNGNPLNTSFTFINEEIYLVYKFIQSISHIKLNNEYKQHLSIKDIDEISISEKDLLLIIKEKPELVRKLIISELSEKDVIATGYRKKQLGVFKDLLYDKAFFEEYKNANVIKTNEGTWQHFFEKNTWIFGYGLNYIFSSPIGNKKLEQVVSGNDAFSSGKRTDALMQTKGKISSLCFIEIKTPTTELLKKGEAYRPESYQVSNELTGGIAQVQKTVQKALLNIKSKTEIKDKLGNLTGESVFLYQPKSYLIIGSLDEFITESGINEDKYSSFELFRRNISNPEIITFDELYERAKHIVSVGEND